MYRVKVKGTVLSISEVKVCEKTGFAKRQIVLEDPDGHKIAPEFHPRNFQLLTEVNEGDEISITCRLKMNKYASANFLIADGVTKN